MSDLGIRSPALRSGSFDHCRNLVLHVLCLLCVRNGDENNVARLEESTSQRDEERGKGRRREDN
jgi:hypothetical protein